MTTETDENYLKEIFMLELDHDHATTTLLADRLGFSAATVTGQLKKLASLSLVAYSPYRGATLTEAGRAIALETIRHHRLLETYLAQALGVPWDRVHVEAERLEHVISEYLEDRIDEMLDHPVVDPHGSPIPSREGTMQEHGQVRLTDLGTGERAEIIEVNDRDPRLLERLDELGLRLGTRLRVSAIEPLDGLITVEVGNERHTLGQTSARQITVRIEEAVARRRALGGQKNGQSTRSE
ncbi:MAG TPA: metal-dependent transcriptional regulator [Spirochaetia bacterium]|nr:metal-dependent transcriptional regulator [Spirochaetia bacterium]